MGERLAEWERARTEGRVALGKENGPEAGFGAVGIYPGGDLRSHTVTRAVSSARRGLTSVFGMGTGVTLAV